MNLVVKQAFADYQPGDQITDPATVQAILDGDQCNSVVKVAAPDPAPTAPDKPKK